MEGKKLMHENKGRAAMAEGVGRVAIHSEGKRAEELRKKWHSVIWEGPLGEFEFIKIAGVRARKGVKLK